jgi:hypothetical protein
VGKCEEFRSTEVKEEIVIMPQQQVQAIQVRGVSPLLTLCIFLEIRVTGIGLLLKMMRTYFQLKLFIYKDIRKTETPIQCTFPFI